MIPCLSVTVNETATRVKMSQVKFVLVRGRCHRTTTTLVVAALVECLARLESSKAWVILTNLTIVMPVAIGSSQQHQER